MTPVDVRALIDLWPTRAALAAALAVKVDRVNFWYRTGRIPSAFWAQLVEVAAEIGAVVSVNDLAQWHDRRRAA